MKNLLLFTVFALITFGAMAQEKANHNTSRSNKTTGGIAELNTDVIESEAGIFERRKCVKAGGTFYEFPNGNTKCLPARVSTKSQSMPSEAMEGGISDRKKCLKSGGVWTTNSVGTFCYKKLIKDVSPDTSNGNTVDDNQSSVKNETDSIKTKSNTSGIGNTANGYQALSLVKGDSGNTNTNESETDSIKIKGSGNTANGYQALSLVKGDAGNASLSKADAERAIPSTEVNLTETNSITTKSNTTGSGNTANGYQSLSLVKGDNGNTTSGNQRIIKNKTDSIKTKANHNTSRSNKNSGGIAELNTDTNESEAGIFERRKCVKAGGTFYEFPNGNTKCLPERVNIKSQNMPSEVMEGGISERKKCLKSGGVWTTNSAGTFCYKKLKTSSRKL